MIIIVEDDDSIELNPETIYNFEEHMTKQYLCKTNYNNNDMIDYNNIQKKLIVENNYNNSINSNNKPIKFISNYGKTRDKNNMSRVSQINDIRAIRFRDYNNRYK